MKSVRINLYVTALGSWVGFVLLGWFHSNPLGILNIFGFLVLIVVPGLLTLLGSKLRRQNLPFWYVLALIVGLSLLELLVFLLLCNTVLPHLHVYRPLDRRPLVIELSALVVLLAIWSWRQRKAAAYEYPLGQIATARRQIIVGFIPLIFVLGAVGGAISLNNGGTDTVSLVTLVCMGAYVVVSMALRRRLNDNTVAWVIYMMGLALLFMTSLRGWYVTGHDIQREFGVFQLTKHGGVWNVADFRDPFNACLSITILPTTLANLLHVPDPYIFKVYFQLIFAIVPVLVYLFMRRYLQKGKAYLAAIYFMAFPTFFIDMCMLNRQEIAFVFLALMLLVIFEARIGLGWRRWLFGLFGTGMILSHYSTTYSAIFTLAVMVCARPAFWWVARRVKARRLFRQTSVVLPPGKTAPSPHAITWTLVAGLALGGFVWNSLLTNTSTAGSVLVATLSNITRGLSEDSKSNDVAYSLFAGGDTGPRQQLIAYQKTVVARQRATASKGTYYPNRIVNAYPLKIVPDASIPLTALGRWLTGRHVNVSSLNFILKQTSAKSLQLFVLLGLGYALLRRRLNRPFEPEFLLLALAYLVFLVLQIVLPYLSVAYGLLRAFQQSLMVIGLFLVVGTYLVTGRFKNAWLRHGLPTVLAVMFFLATTGVISQLLGGYEPQINLNNSGQYYDTYYLHKSEVQAAYWLAGAIRAQRLHGPDIQTDLFTSTRLFALTGIQAQQDITPGLVQQGAFVELGYSDVAKRQVTVPFSGNLLTYAYPTNFLNQTKNLIYTNGGAEVYR